jgi:hypothetical protein
VPLAGELAFFRRCVCVRVWEQCASSEPCFFRRCVCMRVSAFAVGPSSLPLSSHQASVCTLVHVRSCPRPATPTPPNSTTTNTTTTTNNNNNNNHNTPRRLLHRCRTSVEIALRVRHFPVVARLREYLHDRQRLPEVLSTLNHLSWLGLGQLTLANHVDYVAEPQKAYAAFQPNRLVRVCVRACVHAGAHACVRVCVVQSRAAGEPIRRDSTLNSGVRMMGGGGRIPVGVCERVEEPT